MIESLEEIIRNSEKLTDLEGNLLSVAKDKEVSTILITSCNNQEGKTYTATLMAHALATYARAKVLLIDGNIQFPIMHNLFKMSQFPGMTEHLLANTDSGVIRTTEYDNLNVMVHGKRNVDYLQAFRSGKFLEKIEKLKKEYDYIIYDGDSVLSSSDTLVIAKSFDGIVFVIECEKTRWEVMKTTQDKLKKSGGEILGVVLNRRQYYIPNIVY